MMDIPSDLIFGPPSYTIRATVRNTEKALELILRHWDAWGDVFTTAVSIT